MPYTLNDIFDEIVEVLEGWKRAELKRDNVTIVLELNPKINAVILSKKVNDEVVDEHNFYYDSYDEALHWFNFIVNLYRLKNVLG